MLTPKFSLGQDDNFLILDVECPFSKGKDLDFCIEGCEFRFSLNPYYLRLRFSHEIIEDGTEDAEWHVNEGTIRIWLPKKLKKQHFTDLDMISKLLATKCQSKSKPSSTPLIQEINEKDEQKNSPVDHTNNINLDWEIEQTLPSEKDILLGSARKYGFDCSYSNIIEQMPSEYQFEIFGSAIDSVFTQNTSVLRQQNETEKFDIEHYLYDYVDEEENIKQILEKNYWFSKENLAKRLENSLRLDEKSPLSFSSREQQELTMLKIKQKYFINNKQLVLAGLVELLLSFVYCFKIYDGEYDNPEVAWNLVILTPTMCYLESTSEIQKVFDNFMIRSLCYPLYRNWSLSYSCLEDALSLMQLGKGAVLKALIWVKISLERDDSRSVFCRIIVNDYCGWIQSDSFDEKDLHNLCLTYENAFPTVTKQSFSFMPLDEIELLLHE